MGDDKRTKVPLSVTGRRASTTNPSTEGCEIYNSGRYFTVTGRHVVGTPLDIRRVPDATLSRVLHDMEARLPKKAAAVIAPRDTVGQSRYGSGSETDIALCGRLAFWTGRDEAQMDRLFRAPALMRDKSDTVRRADGATYGQKAIAGCRMTYGVQPERNELRRAGGCADDRRAFEDRRAD